jgi:excisionase family DNA binding protein
VNGSPAPLAAVYRPHEVAEMLRCSEWWVKEQARRRRIPFLRIGGRYLFTAEHVAEIVRRFETKPASQPSTVVDMVPLPPALARGGEELPKRLTARVPRRARDAGDAAA